MNCEFCGSNIRGEAQVVNLDGGIFRVCNTCSRLGTPARVPRPVGTRRTFQPQTSKIGARPPQKPRGSGPPSLPSVSYSEEEMMLRDDYSKAIKSARELLGITQEDLGRKINEKPSVISHLEVGSLKPSDLLAKKLEHFLKIELYVPVEEQEGSTP